VETKPPKRLAPLRGAIRARHYSIRTERVYCDWVRRSVLFHGKRHPREMGATEFVLLLWGQRVRVKTLHDTDIAAGLRAVYLPICWRASIPHSKAPAKAHGAVCATPDNERMVAVLAKTYPTPSFPRRRESMDFCFSVPQEQKQRPWIPAFAGTTT
jgi:hypothetical protein